MGFWEWAAKPGIEIIRQTDDVLVQPVSQSEIIILQEEIRQLKEQLNIRRIGAIDTKARLLQ